MNVDVENNTPLPRRRFLGVDFGEKRIGLAVGAAQPMHCAPLTTLERTSDQTVILQILDWARSEDVAAIVVGEPLLLDGTPGPAAHRARSFAAKLAEATELPVKMINESLTSNEAARRLRGDEPAGARHRSRRRKGPSLDAMSAAVLLEDYLAHLAQAHRSGNKAS